ncbi:hypothetical protein NMY22_g6162 [Coprinellus aureogranulatus]|nr:hypothetical protein NMY22_g6162 [Coprinellus aureogranulatus]
MPSSPLPQEILDYMVDIAQQDFDSLKNLALTSRCFVKRSQAYLYRTLRIDRHISQTRRRILEHESRLFKLVRDLRLTFDFSTPPRHCVDIADQQRWLWHVVKELRDLDSLSIRAYSAVTWADVSPQCKEVITQLLGHPLRLATLAWIYCIPALSFHSALASTLERCNLSDVSFETAATSPLITEGKPLKVKSLRCEGPGIRSLWDVLRNSAPQQPAALGNVVHLHLKIITPERPEHWDVHSVALIAQSLRSLQALTLDMPHNFLLGCLYPTMRRLAGDNLTLPTVPRLRYLQIRPSTILTSVLIPPVIPCFLHKFLSKHPQPALEVFEMKASWTIQQRSLGLDDNPPRGASSRILPRDAEWRVLDDTLSSTTLFPALCSVRITPRVTFSPFGPPVPDWKANHMRAFERMKSSHFQKEAEAALEKTHARLPIFDAGGGETMDGRAFDEAKWAILGQERLCHEVI